MDLRHLRTFVTVAEQGTVSKASARLGIAQPALSRQIKTLKPTSASDCSIASAAGYRLPLKVNSCWAIAEASWVPLAHSPSGRNRCGGLTLVF